MRTHSKYNLLAVAIFWTLPLMIFNWLGILAHFFYIPILIAWGLFSMGASTWIGDRTFNRWDDD